MRLCAIALLSHVACTSTQLELAESRRDDDEAVPTENVAAMCEQCTLERCSFAAARACATEADHYLSGAHRPHDLALHGDRAQRACSGGVASACPAIARLYQDGRGGRAHDDERANEWLRRGCVLGDANACFEVGVMAFNGEQATADLRAAQLWIGLAAEMGRRGCSAGRARDCHLLGSMHDRGVGVSTDAALAVSFYERACEAASDDCAALGRAKLAGSGSPRDVAGGVRLLTDTCDAGADASCSALAEYLMTSESPADHGRAVTLLERSCANDEVSACVLLAPALVAGRGVAVDRPRAHALLDHTCDLGDVASCVSLADEVVRAANVAELEKARAWYEAACRMADAPTCAKLGYLIDTGRFGMIDPLASSRAWADACRMGDMDACAHLLHLGREPDVPPERLSGIVARAFQTGAIGR